MLKRVENKKITLWSYIRVVIYFAIAIFAVMLFRKWYIDYYNYERTIPVIKGVFAEINSSEIHNYLQENDNIIIYMCTASNENCRSFETKLKKYIIGTNYVDDITYLNLSEVDTVSFFKNFAEKYQYTKEINTYPSFIVFREGKIVDYLKIRSMTSFNEVKNLIENYGQE